MNEKASNIQEKLQEFHSSSLIIKDFHPKILARLDSNNIEFYIEKVSKVTGEAYKSENAYFGTLKYGLRKLLQELLGVSKLKDTTIFDKYKNYKVADSTKDIYDEVIQDFKSELKLQKKLLKGEK